MFKQLFNILGSHKDFIHVTIFHIIYQCHFVSIRMNGIFKFIVALYFFITGKQEILLACMY